MNVYQDITTLEAVNEEMCWSEKLWHDAPRGHCPCLVKAHALCVTCGMRSKPAERPVHMCGFALRLSEEV